MYSIEYLPVVFEDLSEIFYYISKELKNKTAAEKLIKEFDKQIYYISNFPYANSVYNIESLKKEYRRNKVNNFSIFYTIDNKNKRVLILRVLYNKVNIKKILI